MRLMLLEPCRIKRVFALRAADAFERRRRRNPFRLRLGMAQDSITRPTYTLVDRKAVTMDVDRFTAGFCTLFRFEARVGGAITCPNASRLLRIR
jgi:hypothetical protein